jgi:hypothetical protein
MWNEHHHQCKKTTQKEQCKKSNMRKTEPRGKNNNTIEKNRTEVIFILFPLTLTLNNNCDSQTNNYCLGTLKWTMTLRTKCRFSIL